MTDAATRSGSVVPFLAEPRVRLVLTSGTLLFVELLLIRWIPAEVRYIGFFSNFLLMASFLGIGLGILIGRNGFNPRVSPFAILLAAVVIYVFTFQLNVQIKSDSEIFFGLAESTAVDQNFLILPLIVALIVALLATLALPLGPLLKSMPPLKATASTSPARSPASRPSRSCPRSARTRSSGSRSA